MIEKKTGVYDSPKIREMYGCSSPRCGEYEHHRMCLFAMLVLPVIEDDRRREIAIKHVQEYRRHEKIVQDAKRKQLKEEREKNRKGLGWLKI